MTVKITSSLPKTNGLEAIAGRLVRDPHERHIVIAVIDCARIITDTDTDDSVPVARIRRIEVIRDDATHESHAAALLQAASDRRKGVEPLPFDMYVIADGLADDAVVVDEPDDEGDDLDK